MRTLLCLSVFATAMVSTIAQLGSPQMSSFGTQPVDPAATGSPGIFGTQGASGGMGLSSLLPLIFLSQRGSMSDNPMMLMMAMRHPEFMPFMFNNGEMNMLPFMFSMFGSGMRA